MKNWRELGTFILSSGPSCSAAPLTNEDGKRGTNSGSHRRANSKYWLQLSPLSLPGLVPGSSQRDSLCFQPQIHEKKNLSFLNNKAQ